MRAPRVEVEVEAADVHIGMDRLRAELEIAIMHPPEVLDDAAAMATDATWRTEGRPDRTAVELVTIDPPGSRDLDQAFGAQRRGSGYRVFYAISDVAVFVAPTTRLDAECHRRGVTLYAPDARALLHPAVLSEGAASLLPDGDRPALLWCIDLDDAGMPVETRVERAIVRSDAQLTYPEVHHALESGAPPEALLLLREIGRLRQAAERARGGVSLPTPEQVVVPNGGRYRLEYDAPLPCEDWNAQISLLTGMEAARIMLAGGAGLLRTLPAPDERTLARLQRAAKALGVAWPEHGGYAAFVRAVDPSSPHGAALLVEAAHALRGAGYRGFDHGEVPADAHHAAVAAPYAHVTAPLRRLCDRAANEAVLAHVEGRALPEWVHQELALLPKIMADATRREGSYSRATLDLIEALVLRPWVRQSFHGVVVDVDVERRRAQVQLREPAVVAWVSTPRAVAPGQEVEVVLLAADPIARRVDFAVC